MSGEYTGIKDEKKKQTSKQRSRTMELKVYDIASFAASALFIVGFFLLGA